MKKSYKIIAIVAIVIIIAALAIYFVNPFGGAVGEGESYNATELDAKLSLDMANWSYDEENDIYYQIGIVYCLNPATTEYEALAIYVPGDYFDGTENSNGTYTCTINTNNKVGNYTADTAPLVIPVDTPGYSAQAAQTSYNANEAKDYTDSGFVYVYSGCRGRDNGDNYTGGAPWGVTDLKAAVLYLKFNNDLMPGDTDRIFTFGMSGGGAQSSLMGATGNSELYTPYLESIGAALVDKDGNRITDTVYGSMCWCPITSLDYADEAYEWNLGQYVDSTTRSNGTWTNALSDDLAIEFANYINDLKLKSPDGTTLTLEESDSGIYTSGSYYDYLQSVIEDSLNNFLNDTSFPYTPGSGMGEASTLAGSTGGPSDELGDSAGGLDDSSSGGPNGNLGDSNMSMDSGSAPNIQDGAGDMDSSSDSTTYQTAQDYINSLNSDEQWVSYDSSTNKATITDIGAFVRHCKNPSKDVGAFDSLDKSQAENKVFGTGDENALHFDKVMAKLLTDNANEYSSYSDYVGSYADEYADDLNKVDSLNSTMEERENMYNPMYYLCDYYDGSGSSEIAKYWRINTGIEQSDTALTTEVNLALALNQSSDVEDVQFTTVWGQGHVTAERTGDSTTNFINWVDECLS